MTDVKPKKVIKLKSMYIVDVFTNELPHEELGEFITKHVVEGLEWGKFEIHPLAFGAKKLVVPLVVEEEKINRDKVEEIFNQWVGEEKEIDSFDIVSQENY